MILSASRLAVVRRPQMGASVWIEIADEAGNTGLGEASPLPPFSLDDDVVCAEALDGVHARVGVIDLDAVPVEAVERALEPVSMERAPAARFALETAILDLIGKRRGVSVAEILGGRRPLRDVPVNGLLFASPDPEGLPARARSLVEAGMSAIKIKLRAADDAGFAREVEALAAVRAILPPPFEIRLDPNAAWGIDEARAKMARLAAILPRFIEQPVAPAEILRLGRTAVPWAADEALADPALVAPLLDAEGCAAFILKPAVIGGVLRARSIAMQAEARGIGVVVTHLFDGPIAMAAAAELALSLPHPPLACGLDPHAGLAAFPRVEIPQLARRGWITPSGRAGIGITLPEESNPWTRSR